MAKRPTIVPVVVPGASDTLNQNFNALADAFENTISRDGSIPNNMVGDIDLNSQDLLNGGTISAEDIIIRGTPLGGIIEILEDIQIVADNIDEIIELNDSVPIVQQAVIDSQAAQAAAEAAQAEAEDAEAGATAITSGLVPNIGKMFQTRQEAVDAGQAALPDTYKVILTIEDGDFVFRVPGNASSTEDPLFPGSYPAWRVYWTIPNPNREAAQQNVIRLENIGGTPDAITADWPPSVVGGVLNLVAGTVFMFQPLATNTAPAPTINIEGVQRQLRDADNSELPAGALDPLRHYTFVVVGVNRAKMVTQPTSLSDLATPTFGQVAGGDVAADVDVLRAGLVEDGPAEQRGSVDDLSLVSTVTGAGSGNIVVSTPVSNAGSIDSLTIYADSADTVKVRSWTSPDAVNFTLYDSEDVLVTAGYGVYPVSVAVPAGGYAGAQGGGVIGINASGTPFNFYAGPTDDFVDNNGTGSNSYTFSLSISTRQLVDISGGGGEVAIKSPARFRMVGGQGQSNMVGSAATAGITLQQRYGTLGFANKGTTVLPLDVANTGSSGTSEWPGPGFAIAYQESLMFDGGAASTHSLGGIIVGHSALGGTAIANLGPGSAEYIGAQNQIIAAANYVRSLGSGLSYLGSMWIQGERDIVDGTAEATYRDALINLAANHDLDARNNLAEFGSSQRYPLFCVQTTSGLPYAASPASAWAIPKAQLDASNLSQLVQIACPMYHLPFVQNNHVTGEGSRLMGSYLERCAEHWERTGTSYAALQAVEWRIDGADILIAYNRTGLVLDATWQVPQQAQEGFTVWNGAVEVPITTVVASGNEVRLTPSSTPATGWRWTYGEKAATGLGVYTGGAGNLRDSAGTNDIFFGVAKHNAALMQEGTV